MYECKCCGRNFYRELPLICDFCDGSMCEDCKMELCPDCFDGEEGE